MESNKTTMRTTKRLIALLLCLVMAVMTLPTQVFAATGDVGTISFAFTYDANGNAIRYNSNAVINGYTAGGTGNYKYRMYVDGDTAFCIQPGAPLHAGDTLKESSSATWNALSSDQKKAIGLALLYGYQGNKSNLAGSDDEIWLATQTLVWEFATECRNATGSYKQTSTTVYSLHFGSNYANSGAQAAYEQIVALLAEHNTIPSFMSESSTGITKELSYSGGKYTITLTDSNGVLSDYTFACSDSNVSITKSGDNLIINSTKAIDGSVRITATRNNVPAVSTSTKLLAYGDASLQDVVTGVENADNVNAYINIETPIGTLTLKKTSEDDIVSGIKFIITGDNFEQTVTTGSDGTIAVEGLLPGIYTVTESDYDRYVPQKSQTVTVIGGQTSTVSFSNVLKKFRVTVTKSDVETGTAQGNASLAGAVYGVYKGDELVDTYTTDVNGQFTTLYYICGDNWTIREITPSEGYLLNTEAYHIGAEAKNYTVEYSSTTNGVTEQVIKGNIHLVKHIDSWDKDVDESEQDGSGNAGMVEQPEEGAVFQIYLTSASSYENAKETERDLLTTDADGFAVSKDLPYGRYTVHQVSGMEGQSLISDFTVYINTDGRTYSYILNNDTITALVRIEKHDAETGKIIPLSGIGFQVRDLSTGELVSQTINYPTPVTLDTFYTSDEGWLMLPYELAYGDYELIEVETAYGYVLNNDPVPFTIDGSSATVIVIKENMPQKGTITITKTGEAFSSIMENDRIYQPVYEIRSISGATYDVIADEDIYTGDGTLRASADDIVATVTTNESGTATTDLLYLGRYRVVERQAPDGMVLNTEEIIVELTYAGQLVKVTSTETGVYNERQKVELSLEKTLETDELFGIGNNEEMLEITFGLYTSEDIVATDGSVIPTGGLIETITLDNEGRGIFNSDLPINASYYVQEIATEKHYILNDAKFPVIFAYQGQETAVVQIVVNDGEAIENKLLRGDIKGTKLGEDGEGLEGAMIGLFDPVTEEFTEQNALITTTSAEDGSFAFEDVPYGYWIVCEIEAPEGYVLSSEQHQVYIAEDNSIIEISIENTRIRGSVQLIKTDADYPDNKLEGAVFEVYEDSNGNKELDDEDVLIGKLEEVDAGVHELHNLVYGRYLVKESVAPEGFILDGNAYFFEIITDGETVVVENEAGKGFINQAQIGGLKIIKTSSDGKKEGFSFKVERDNYSETFTTDANGEIYIESLRVGTYTITEVSDDASSGYVLPDPVKVEIAADEILEVRIHNDKVTETTSVPKTGDDSNVLPWLVLLGTGLAGGVTTVILALKKKKRTSEMGAPATE